MKEYELVIAEMLYPKGHKTLDNKLISLFSRKYKTLAVNYNNFITCQDCDKINLKRQFVFKCVEPLLIGLLIVNMIILRLSLRHIDYKAILFLSINNKVTPVLKYIFPSTRIFVMHHNDIDAMIRFNQVESFKRGMNNVDHIVFGDFIKDRIVELTGIDANRVFSIPHPTTITINDDLNEINSKSLIVGLGLSNDEQFIDDCIEYDKKNKTTLDYRIVLRSRSKKYEGNNLLVFTGYLTEEEYNDYFKKAASVVVYYPDKFQYRYSGSLINAIAETSCVFINKMPLGLYEHSVYPHLCRIIDSAEDLFTLNRSSFISCDSLTERRNYLAFHSDVNVLKEIEKLRI